MTEHVYNFIRRFPTLTYLQYKSLSDLDQDQYLNWSQFVVDLETQRIAFERNGGVPGLAKKEAIAALKYLNAVNTWSYLNCHFPTYRKNQIKDIKITQMLH